MKIQIMVAAHKPYWIPEDDIYLPVFVGAAGKQITPDYVRDDTGDNISLKNPTFCELTGLYWVWKNVDADVYGLCHYRRYLGGGEFRRKKTERLLKGEEIQQLLASSDIILPKKRHYWIETRESQYAHAHHIEDLECVEGILSERYPDYLSAWKWMLGTRSGHICNMFIMRKEQFDTYCNWLFDILFEAERRLDISTYADKDKRVFGYLGERLLDVWIMTNKLVYAEKPMITLEDQHWIQKGFHFLRRKFQH